MRSVVLSIAVHAGLGTLAFFKVHERVPVPELIVPLIALEGPRPIEVEVYIEPPSAQPDHGTASAMPASPARSRAASGSTVGPSAVSVTTAATRDMQPDPVAVPHAVTLPSPHDAAEATNVTVTGHGDPPATTPTSSNTFRMRVDGDGTAHITDRRNFQWGRGGSTAYGEEHAAERWLEEHHEQSNAVEMKMPELPIPVGTFDVTDAAMRIAGQDPYAYEKLKALDATRDQRAEIGARHRERQLVDTPALVRASLAELVHLPADQRAAAIRELYLDCDDSPAGEVARATIADYVRAHGLAIELPKQR